jgi:bacterioferritin-associated ferredoxin
MRGFRVYVCICARVRECDLRAAVRCGARSEDSVGDACGAGQGCGMCVDRIRDVIDEENHAEAFIVPLAA